MCTEDVNLEGKRERMDRLEDIKTELQRIQKTSTDMSSHHTRVHAHTPHTPVTGNEGPTTPGHDLLLNSWAGGSGDESA